MRLGVVFTGMLEDEMKEGALAAADAFVLPSHQENFGMSVAEALAAGLPVLISNRVNIWREIDNDRAGYVENDDLTGTTAVDRALAGAPRRRSGWRMRANARACFSARFEINHAIDSLLRVLQETSRRRMKITIVLGAFLPVPRHGRRGRKSLVCPGAEFARRGHDVTQVSRQSPRFPGVKKHRRREASARARFRHACVHFLVKFLDLIYSLRATASCPESDIIVTTHLLAAASAP